MRKRTRDIMGPVCDTPAKLAHWRLKELWNLGDLVTYRRELKKLITAAGRSEDTEFIGDATNVALFHLSSMTEAGRIDGVDRLLALLLPVIPEWADDRPVYNGFRLGLAYTISGGVRMHALAPKAALAAYRTAVTVLSARDSTPYYLVNALIRQGAAQIALGTAADARNSLKQARELAEAQIAGRRTSFDTHAQLSTALTLTGYTWLMAGTSHDLADELFQGAVDAARAAEIDEFDDWTALLAEAAAISGQSSLNHLRKRRELALKQADQVVAMINRVAELAPEDPVVDVMRARAGLKQAAIACTKETLGDVVMDVFGAHQPVQDRIKAGGATPEMHHIGALRGIICCALAADFDAPVAMNVNFREAVRTWRKLMPKIQEPEFIHAECLRLCGLDLNTPNNWINLSHLKRDESIRGPSSVIFAAPPLFRMEDAEGV